MVDALVPHIIVKIMPAMHERQEGKHAAFGMSVVATVSAVLNKSRNRIPAKLYQEFQSHV
jgi:hypothetical protein